MAKHKDAEFIGQTFNRLTVLAHAGRNANLKRLVRCRCACGTEKTIILYSVMSGVTKSCGCFSLELSTERIRLAGRCKKPNARRHGMSRTSEYSTWNSMKMRCFNPNIKNYKDYGARGITVCDSWLLFDNFFADMGRRPTPKHQLDRIDNEGNYDPTNCRWATPREQACNRRSSRNLTLDGVTMSTFDWSKRLGLSRNIIARRLKNGWGLREALTTTALPTGMRRKFKHR